MRNDLSNYLIWTYYHYVDTEEDSYHYVDTEEDSKIEFTPT